MFYRLNLLIIRHICLCCIAENINVNENIFVEKLYSNYLPVGGINLVHT